MSFIESIRNKSKENIINPNKVIHFKSDKMIKAFKELIVIANNTMKQEVCISGSELMDKLNFSPDRRDLMNSFLWFKEEAIDFEYKWDNNIKDFVLKINW